MCRCTPDIRAPWCPKCRPDKHDNNVGVNIDIVKDNYEKVKYIVMYMNGLSEAGFENKYLNDPLFHKGVDTLAHNIPRKEKVDVERMNSYDILLEDVSKPKKVVISAYDIPRKNLGNEDMVYINARLREAGFDLSRRVRSEFVPKDMIYIYVQD